MLCGPISALSSACIRSGLPPGALIQDAFLPVGFCSPGASSDASTPGAVPSTCSSARRACCGVWLPMRSVRASLVVLVDPCADPPACLRSGLEGVERRTFQSGGKAVLSSLPNGHPVGPGQPWSQWLKAPCPGRSGRCHRRRYHRSARDRPWASAMPTPGLRQSPAIPVRARPGCH